MNPVTTQEVVDDWRRDKKDYYFEFSALWASLAEYGTSTCTSCLYEYSFAIKSQEALRVRVRVREKRHLSFLISEIIFELNILSLFNTRMNGLKEE